MQPTCCIHTQNLFSAPFQSSVCTQTLAQLSAKGAYFLKSVFNIAAVTHLFISHLSSERFVALTVTQRTNESRHCKVL